MIFTKAQSPFLRDGFATFVGWEGALPFKTYEMKYFVENQKRLSEVSDRFKEEGYMVSPIEGLCHCGKAQAVAILTNEEDLDIQIVVCQMCHDTAPLIQQL